MSVGVNKDFNILLSEKAVNMGDTQSRDNIGSRVVDFQSEENKIGDVVGGPDPEGGLSGGPNPAEDILFVGLNLNISENSFGDVAHIAFGEMKEIGSFNQLAQARGALIK